MNCTGKGAFQHGASCSGGQGVWMAGVSMAEACMAGGCAWQGAMHDRGACVAGGVRARRDGHCSGRYASFWNAFLLLVFNTSVFYGALIGQWCFVTITASLGHFKSGVCAQPIEVLMVSRNSWLHGNRVTKLTRLILCEHRHLTYIRDWKHYMTQHDKAFMINVQSHTSGSFCICRFE